jgi:cell division transport system permease protein
MNFMYFIREAMRGFYQAKLMTFISVMTISLTLFFLGCVSVGFLNIRLWLKNAESRVQAVVYIDDAVASDSGSLAAISAKIRKSPEVATAIIIDKNEAWNRFRELYGGAMLEAVDENPFPVSIELTLSERGQSSASVEALRNELSQIKGVEDVQLSRQWVMFLQRFRNYFLAATICVALALIVTLHFMIANTIKLTIYGRKELVRNMQFVGATGWYIKTPFLLEGMLQGGIGGAIGVIGLYIVKISLSHFPVAWGPWYLFLLLFPIGALFGCIGSMSAVRKFLVS